MVRILLHMFTRFFSRPVLAAVVAIAGMSLGCDDRQAGPTQLPPPPAALAVTFVAPSTGLASANTAIQIGGTGFQAGATLTIDGAAAPATVVSSTVITSIAPPHATGRVDVVVTNPGGQSSRLAGGFTYVLPLATLLISGNTSLASVGETSHLTATATYVDGSTQDLTRNVQWSSQAAAVVSIAADGVLTARALGAATIQLRYQAPGSNSSLFRFAYVTVTPPGTFVVSGRVREPGAGSLSGVRVLHPATGQETLTSGNGSYSFAGLTSSRFSFTKAEYEAVEAELTPNEDGDVPLQRIVRIEAGASVSPTLAPNDVDYLVSAGTHCQPCRLIRVTSTTAGTLQVRVTWTTAQVLNVWVNGQAFLASAGVREVVADVPAGVGEVVVYVGKTPAPIGDYVGFTMSTTLR